MRAPLPALSLPLILLAAACGRHAPPAAGPSAPLARPAAGARQPSSSAPAPAESAAPAQGPVVTLVPSEPQRVQMAGALRQTLAGIQAGQSDAAQAYAAEKAKQQAQYAAALADYRAKQAAQAAAAKERLDAARAEWDKRAAGYQAMLADPKASATDKENARAALAAGFVPPAGDSDTMPPPSAPQMPPSPPLAGDPKATADCDQWIYRFRQAVEAHDHAKALAAMQAIGGLASKASPALLASYMGEANRYLAGPAAVVPVGAPISGAEAGAGPGGPPSAGVPVGPGLGIPAP